LTSFEAQSLVMRNKITKRPVARKAKVPQEATQPKKKNATTPTDEDNVSEAEHEEDVCKGKQCRTGEDLKLRYSSRLKGKDTNCYITEER